MKAKRLLALILSVLLVVTGMPYVFADEPEAPVDTETVENETYGDDATVVDFGTCGDSLKWELTDDGTLTISGTGPMWDYDSAVDPAPWKHDDVTTIKIKSGVTSIGEDAFYNCYDLQSVTIPSGVTSIGDSAFYDCSSLQSVTIPGSVTSIGDGAFGSCGSLQSVTIPSSVTNIGEFAFSNCKSLQSVTIPASVPNISAWTFSNCTSLQSVTIPGSVTSIGYRAFENCDFLQSVTIPTSVTCIGHSAFSSCDSLKSVKIPGSVQTIEANAFGDCTALETVVMEKGVMYVGGRAFNNCTSLTNITLPEGIVAIGDGAFENCVSLTGITIPSTIMIVGMSLFGHSSSAEQQKQYIIKGYEGTDVERACKETPNLIFESIGGKVAYPLDTPKFISAIKTGNKLKLTWNAVPGAGEYRLFFGRNDTVVARHIDTTETSYTWEDPGIDDYYCFEVRCVADDGVTYLSGSSEFDSLLIHITNMPESAPKISSVTNTVEGIEISWNEVANAQKYRVFYKTTGSWQRLADTSFTSYTWTDATAGTKYSFTVRCLSKDGLVYFSDWDITGMSLVTPEHTPEPTPMPVPEPTSKPTATPTATPVPKLAAPKLTSVKNTSSGIQFTWQKVSGAEKYRVYFKTGNGGWKKIGDTTKTTYTRKDANLKAGTKYTFTVRAVDKNGKTSGYDKTGKAVTYVKQSNVSKVENTTSGIKITWKKSSGAQTYRVYYKGGGKAKWTKLADVKGTSYTWKKAKSWTKYTFTVKALGKNDATASYNNTGKSITYLSAPAKITAAKSGSTGIKVSWAKVTGAKKYRIYYKTTGGWKKLTDTTKTSYTWKKGKKGTKYTFTVRAIAKDGKTMSAYNTTGKSVKR